NAYQTFALKTDATLWAWGAGGFGDGTSKSSLVPVRIMTGVLSVSTRFAHVLVTRQDGSVLAWLGNTHGELGDAGIANRTAPVEVLTATKNIGAGLFHSLAVRNDGGLSAWGGNLYGELG